MDRRSILSGGGALYPVGLRPTAWFYASRDYVTFFSDPQMNSWRDRSGNGNHITTVGASYPTFSADGWNGRSAIVFDGAAAYLTSTGALATQFSGTDIPFTVLMTLQFDSAAPDHGLCQWNDGGNSLSQLRSNTTGALEQQRYQRRDSGGTMKTLTGTVTMATEKTRLAYVFTGTRISTYVNSTLDLNAADADVGNCTFTEFTLGKSLIGQMDGKMTECVILDYAASENQVLGYHNYSVSEWT